ncbi:hypothetical protein [Alkalimarinus alittae]|uniref:Uncharacterized protein n=1 Tax=Alkalimarinus alittae TaxID=2961619 RepID=A0ABY6N5L4_9ALTE|nr:hypothetical protein [Alkalimarinus alittae]UZE97423.1 hypothetical protein NKI27_06655 [Alkalimarinus alittae]
MVKKLAVTIGTLAVFALMAYVLVSGGKPINSDLSVIGQGKPVLVLAYENFSPVGGEALNLLRQVRDDFESQLDFVVAELGTPAGDGFASGYKMTDGMAVFLTSDGQPLRIINIPTGERELRLRLESLLSTAE